MPELDSGLYIQIIRFRMTPEKQEALLAAILGQVDGWARGCDGFVSANFHVSEDRRTVINYAQWRDAAAFEAFLGHDRQEDLRRAIEAVGPERAEADGFALARTVLPG